MATASSLLRHVHEMAEARTVGRLTDHQLLENTKALTRNLRTDAEGRFRIEGIVPGFACDVTAMLPRSRDFITVKFPEK